jgi:uncharacterized protein
VLAKIYSLKAGSKIPDELLSLAAQEKVRTASVEGIGGVKELRLAYFNHEAKKYEEHRFEGFMEVTGLVGNITSKDGKPFVHVHGTFGRKDLGVLGGHVVSATVFPLLEVVVTPTNNRAVRRFDDEVGLNVIYKP